MAVRFARGMTGSPDVAEDLFQEAARATYERAREGSVRFESVDHARNYLFRAVRNLAVDARRGRRDATLDRASSAPATDPAPLEVLAHREHEPELAAIRAAVCSLRRRDRELIEMRFTEGQTFREISQASGISISTLHSRVESALRKIRRSLGNRFAEP